MAASLGAEPVLCGFLGGESGELLGGLLKRQVGRVRLVDTVSASGCYVTDRRSGERELLTCTLSDPPSRHELDELFSITCAEAIADGWLVLTNPMPADALPLEIYGDTERLGAGRVRVRSRVRARAAACRGTTVA
jgi:1-phosphofructokinase